MRFAAAAVAHWPFTCCIFLREADLKRAQTLLPKLRDDCCVLQKWSDGFARVTRSDLFIAFFF